MNLPDHVPTGRIAAVLAIIVAGVVLARGTGTPRFRAVAHGIEFSTVRGDPYCRQGSSDIAVLRVDPASARFRVHYFAPDGEHPVDILEWQRRTGAVAVFNAGQYYPDHSYMGLLMSGGKRLSDVVHPTFKAALVADPMAGPRRVRVLDLEQEPIDPSRPDWREVAQSFMLFDSRGVIRVKKTGQIAPRTIVAEDLDHRVLVIASEGSYTLYDLATLLKSSPLHLTHAMSMDGGAEAQLYVRSRDFHYANFGHWDPVKDDAAIRATLVPLPAVVTVSVE